MHQKFTCGLTIIPLFISTLEAFMKIVIIGLGTIGKTILRILATENHTITIIDDKKDKVEELIEKYDVFGVVGNGASMDIQKEAMVKDADVVLAITDSDELNIFASMVARKLGAKNTIARVRNPDYSKQIAEMKEYLGISMLVNPEKDTATEIFNLISLPPIVQVEHFAKGRVLLVEIVAKKGCSLVGETLISLGKKLSTKVLICAVQRKNKVFIPSGNFTIEEGDKIHFTSDVHTLSDFLSEINLVQSPLKNVMIVGGSKISIYLAEQLSKKKYRVKLLESNKETAEAIAEALPQVTVIHGNGTRHDILIEEGLEAMDAFVALSSIDEENMVVSMFASKMNVKKTITQIKSDELDGMLSELGMNNNVSPKHVVANRIASYIRALANKRGSNVLTLSRLVNDQVEALEFAAKTQEKFYNTPLKDLRIKENCLIACIIRQTQVLIPDGNSCIRQGDNVIVVTTHKHFDDLSDIFM
ncbi:MAG: Trk system potassium transporter TrkA [Clostridiales bacterium]|nr:Trk system potassium transporter TrkA [Clostridiales bacterium]